MGYEGKIRFLSPAEPPTFEHDETWFVAHEIRRSSSAQLIHALWTYGLTGPLLEGRIDALGLLHVQYVVELNGGEDD